MSQFENARLLTRSGTPVMLQGVTASGDLKGLLFEATIEQRFCNPTDKNMEVVYTFPLPWGAVLMGVDVQLGDKHLTGAVVEKKQAEARYEEALSEGHAAIMLEKNHDLSYSLNLGNLAAKETCVITLRYAQTLQFEQRGLRLLIPTVIAPRFGDAVIDAGLQAHQAPVHSLVAEYPFNIVLRLHGDLARARVASPSHPVGMAQTVVDGETILTVSLGRSASLDRDFVLVMDQLIHDSVAVLARDMVDTDSVVAMASFCPLIPHQGPVMTAVKILVDCSGSMAGDSIAAAKRSLQAVVQQLGTGDRFSLSRFGSTVEHRSRGLWSVTDPTRLAAQRWIGVLDADLGGTEMESALMSTFALAQTVTSDVLLVTDGEISAIDQTIESAKVSGHRLFVVGIGSSPAESHLRRLAEATGGACDFVAPGEAVEPAILRMFARLRSPRLIDLKTVWPEGFAPAWETELAQSVFDGDTVSVFAKVKQVPVGVVRLMGRVGQGTELIEVGSAVLGAEVQQSNTLSRMAVAESLRRKSSKEQAVAYQLVTDQTNFLLIHERAAGNKPADMPELHQVEQMLAAGWGGTGDSSIKFCMMDSQEDYYIPMFSRKPVDIHLSVWRTRDRTPAVEKLGVTPLSLCAWLRATPEINWPESFQSLCDLGVDRWVVEWLEIYIPSQHAKSVTEQVIVRTFLHVMAQREMFDELSKGRDTPWGIKGMVQKFTGLFTAVHGQSGIGVDEQLAKEIDAGLLGMTTDSWPDQVVKLDEAVSAPSDSELPPF